MFNNERLDEIQTRCKTLKELVDQWRTDVEWPREKVDIALLVICDTPPLVAEMRQLQREAEKDMTRLMDFAAKIAAQAKEIAWFQSEVSERATMETTHLKQVEVADAEAERLEDRLTFEQARAESLEKALEAVRVICANDNISDEHAGARVRALIDGKGESKEQYESLEQQSARTYHRMPVSNTDAPEGSRYKGMDPNTPGLWYCPGCGISWYKNDTPEGGKAIQKYGKCLKCLDAEKKE